MFDIAKVQNCYSGYIGWRSSDDPCEKPLSNDVTSSSSGLYFNEFHPLLTYDNIKSIAINPKSFNIDTWDVLEVYNAGKKVIYNNGTYDSYFQSLIDGNTGLQPDLNPLEWVEVDFLSEWYKQRTNNSFNKLINSIAITKKLNSKTKTILENFKLFTSEGRIKETITPSGRFVGYAIKVKSAENLTILLKQIGLQFTSIQSDLNIYIYHSSQNEAISITPLTTTQLNSFQWFTSDLRLDFVNDLIDTGVFYLGYYEDDILGNAINKSLNFNNPCVGCQGWKYKDYQNLSQFMSIAPISVANIDLNFDKSIFDIEDVRYTNNTNFGINLNINIRCDWSDFICQNKDLFINAYRTQIAYDMMNEMLYSTRDNDLRQKINAAIQGNESIDGYQAILNKEIEALNFDMSDLGSPCMPCEKQKGMRLKTA